MTRRLAFVALAAVVALCPAACSSGGQAEPAASPSQNSVQRELAVAKRFATCARAHGRPAFPDPVIDGQGRVTYPASSGADGNDRKREIGALESVPECKAILNEMQTLTSRSDAPGPEVIQKLRRFAQCVRQHGVPAFPDPKSDGMFERTFPGSGGTMGSPAVKAAMVACRQYRTGTENFGGFSS
jgi:hypothetical protein